MRMYINQAGYLSGEGKLFFWRKRQRVSYSPNEITIYWNSPAIFVSAFLNTEMILRRETVNEDRRKGISYN